MSPRSVASGDVGEKIVVAKIAAVVPAASAGHGRERAYATRTTTAGDADDVSVCVDAAVKVLL